MPAGSRPTTNLCSHLSCKNREACDEMIGKELSNVSVTSQNKYNLARLKFSRRHEREKTCQKYLRYSDTQKLRSWLGLVDPVELVSRVSRVMARPSILKLKQ